MKVLSLFSGVGGFDLGLERAGMQTVFQCEWDKHASKILERHWPHVPRWDDVSTLTGKHILQYAPVIDIVAWGSPCQDLSVAGKRAGLDGERSGLFHQGIRIIKELLEETNGRYPRISLWENVYGALNSNRGADFGVILDEMAEAGSLVQEWRVLDAQYFGVPQRRRRVFLVSVFDPATAARCPDPLLPISESMRRDTSESAATREEPAEAVAQGFGNSGFQQWREIDTAVTLSTRDYKGSMTMVVESTRLLGSEIVGSLNAVDYKWPQNQQLDENKFIVVETGTSFTGSSHADYREGVGTLRASGGDLGGGSETLLTFTKSKRAQTADDNETWVENQPAPTLNAFDQGDTRTTAVVVGPVTTHMSSPRGSETTDSHHIIIEPVIAFATNQRAEVRELDDKAVALAAEPGTNQQTYIAFENSYRDGVRIATEDVSQTLSAKMGTGGNNTPMIAFSHTQGLSAQPSEYSSPTLRREGSGMAVAYPIQDGRDMEKHQNGLGIGEEGAPSYTLMTTGAQAVAIGIQGNVIGRQDHNGPAGKGHTEEGDPMFTLTSTDVHAVAYTLREREGKPGGGKGPLVTEEKSGTLAARANDQTIFQPTQSAIQYDGYNQKINDTDVSVTLRLGRDSSDFVAQPVDAAGFKPGASSNAHSIGYEEGLSPSLEAGGGGNNRPAVLEPTMAVRRLTPVECERLMGWPDGWTDGQADTHRYKQCGNGVASPVAQWIAEQLLQLDKDNHATPQTGSIPTT